MIISKVAFTDKWPSTNKFAFIVITATFLDESYKPFYIIIGFRNVPRDHYRVNLTNSFYENIESYNRHMFSIQYPPNWVYIVPPFLVLFMALRVLEKLKYLLNG